MENETSPWVQTGDGLFEPSRELIQRIRENPEQFPHAVEDLTVLSGKTREEVEDILSANRNPGGALGRGIVRGLGKAGGMLADNLFGEGTGNAVRDATNFNPGFSTEQSTVESVGEVVGQAAPAVAGAVATGGALPAAIVGAGITTLTFEDEDNLANLANDYIDGAVPDFLVVDENDDEGTATAKHLASNLIVDLATAGLGSAISKVYRVFKEAPKGLAELPTELSQGTPGLSQELERIATEAGVPLRPEPGSQATAKKAVEQVAKEAADDIVEGPVRRSRALKEAARDKVADDILTKEIGHNTAGQAAKAQSPVPQEVVDAWQRDTLNPVKRLLERSHETNVGRRAALKAFEEGPGAQAYREISEQALRAAYDSNLPELTAAVKQIDSLQDTVNANRVFKDSVLRSAMEMVDSRFDEVIELIRKDPTLKTRDALKMVATDYHKTRVALQEMYRETGSSSAYAFLVRKGGVNFDEGLIKQVNEASEEVMKTVKDNGLSIFATKAEFKAQRLLDLDEMGFDTLAVLDELDRMFDDFDKMRQGTLANFSQNAMSRMTKAQREAAEGSFLRWLNDMHSSALLGQFSTAALEGMSNALNMTVLPLLQHGFWRSRAWREYAGYMAEWNRLWGTFKAATIKGRAVTDDFDILDAQHSKAKGILNRDYDSLLKEGKHLQHLMYRLWDFASGLSIAASEGTKSLRYAGLAYADGFELALKSGMARPQAKKAAKEYVASKFNPDGSFKDAALKLDVAQGAWQGAFDTRTVTGYVAQKVDNLRNSTNPVANVLARSAVPFWRTLINIGSNSMQMVQPIPSSVLQPLARTKWGGKVIGATKFMDDFSGRNGLTAKNRAIGRQRLGFTMLGGSLALMEAGVIDITGPSDPRKRWDQKIAEGQEYPGSSLIIGGKSIDLTRFLPYSAPLLLAGIMKDVRREEALRMQGGQYVSEDSSAWNLAATYGTALQIMMYSLLSDSAALRGAGDLFDTISKAMQGDLSAAYRHIEDYGKQFTPGGVRMIGKNRGAVTGDWTQHEAEGFLNEALAAAGWPVGYERLDFLGKPVDDDWLRGVDPTNMKPVRVSDPIRAEYVLLNRTGDLGLLLDKPDKVFDKAFWKNHGVQPSFWQELTGTAAPSLNELRTTGGENAWKAYRDRVYQGRVPADVEVSTGASGDRFSIGKVPILKGENWEDAIRRTVTSPDYATLTPDARVKVWRALFGHFKKKAKEYVEEHVVIPPDLFEGGKYEKPTDHPATLQAVTAAAKENAIETQKSQGIPLDEIFRIK